MCTKSSTGKAKRIYIFKKIDLNWSNSWQKKKKKVDFFFKFFSGDCITYLDKDMLYLSCGREEQYKKN